MKVLVRALLVAIALTFVLATGALTAGAASEHWPENLPLPDPPGLPLAITH
jgi:hypothetical protein